MREGVGLIRLNDPKLLRDCRFERVYLICFDEAFSVENNFCSPKLGEQSKESQRVEGEELHIECLRGLIERQLEEAVDNLKVRNALNFIVFLGVDWFHGRPCTLAC